MRFKSVSLSGFSTNCTLTTAQRKIQYEGQLQYGVIGIGSEQEGDERNRKANEPKLIFNSNKQLVSGSSDEKIKLIRAQGGCHGTIRR